MLSVDNLRVSIDGKAYILNESRLCCQGHPRNRGRDCKKRVGPGEHRAVSIPLKSLLLGHVKGFALHRDQKIIPSLAAGEAAGMAHKAGQKPFLAAVGAG